MTTTPSLTYAPARHRLSPFYRRLVEMYGYGWEEAEQLCDIIAEESEPLVSHGVVHSPMLAPPELTDVTDLPDHLVEQIEADHAAYLREHGGWLTDADASGICKRLAKIETMVSNLSDAIRTGGHDRSDLAHAADALRGVIAGLIDDV